MSSSKTFMTLEVSKHWRHKSTICFQTSPERTSERHYLMVVWLSFTRQIFVWLGLAR